MKKFILTLIVLLFASPLWAATRYVDNTIACTGNYSIANRACNGSDGNSYTTMQAAENASSTNDTIWVRGGPNAAPVKGTTPGGATYFYASVTISPNDLTFAVCYDGSDGDCSDYDTGDYNDTERETVIIDGQSTRASGIIVADGTTDVTIDGFIVQYHDLPDEQRGNITVGNSSYRTTVRNCTIRWAVGSPTDSGELAFEYSAHDSIVENNYFESTTGNDPYQIFIKKGDGMIIRDNEFVNACSALASKNGSSSNEIYRNWYHDLQTNCPEHTTGLHYYCRDGTNCKFYNNVVEGPHDMRAAVTFYDSENSPNPTENHEVYNNTFINADGSRGTIDLESSSGVKIKNNLFINSGVGVVLFDWNSGSAPEQASATYDYNIFYNTTACDEMEDQNSGGCSAGDGGHNLTSNPNINASGDKPNPYYHFQSSSPAKNAGDPSTTVNQAGSVDYNRNPRFVGQIDIGAFESRSLLAPPSGLRIIRIDP